MHIVLVHVHVKPERGADFRAAATENAIHSLQEPGVTRFDVLQMLDDPDRFMLVEVYRSEADVARHKETVHYLKWRDTVADMMAEPRNGVKYVNIFPEDAQWG